MKKSFLKLDLSDLTLDQKLAAKEFSSWIEKKHQGNPFVLSGCAGSGKTFLAMRLLHKVEDLGICWTIAAPTHKAVGVMRQVMATEALSPTWYPSTIHRLLRLKLKRKGDLEICEQTDQTPQSLEKLGLVLIDESSMIDKKLLEILLQCAYPNGTRLVFVGDPAQLPPVGESISPVFSMQRMTSCSLKEVVRHQGPVLNLANCIRDSRIPCNQPPCLPLIQDKRGLVACLDQENWLSRAQQALKLTAENSNPDDARILCYTNRCLENLVPLARRAIHGDMADQLPVLPGEVLITRTAVMTPASSGEVEDEEVEEPNMILGSNRELIVRDVTPEKCDLAEFGLSNEQLRNIPAIETFTLDITAGNIDLALRFLPPVGTEARNSLDVVLNRLKAEAKELGKQDGRNLWRKFFFVRDSFASLGPASVLTVHRSQGSTFNQVFVASDVFWPKDILLRKQLVYVAVSRARDGVWMVGNKNQEQLRNNWLKEFREFNIK